MWRDNVAMHEMTGNAALNSSASRSCVPEHTGDGVSVDGRSRDPWQDPCKRARTDLPESISPGKLSVSEFKATRLEN